MNYLRVGDMAKEANFVFLAIFSGGRPFFSAVFYGLVPPDMFPGGRPCSLGWQESQPCTERLLMNCAPCITRLFSGHLACPVPEKGVSGTEYPFRTVEACFLHRMPQKMRRVPEEACFLHGAHIPYRRRPFLVPNSANARKEKSLACTECFKRQKGERYCLHRIYQTARKEKGVARNMTRNAAASKKITASVPKTHRQTAPQIKGPPQLHTRLHTRPTKNTTNTKHHQHPQSPPRLSEKSASQSAIGLLGYSGRGRTNRRGTFRTGSPTGTKKRSPE